MAFFVSIGWVRGRVECTLRICIIFMGGWKKLGKFVIERIGCCRLSRMIRIFTTVALTMTYYINFIKNKINYMKIEVNMKRSQKTNHLAGTKNLIMTTTSPINSNNRKMAKQQRPGLN